jgi:hypothetical protein
VNPVAIRAQARVLARLDHPVAHFADLPWGVCGMVGGSRCSPAPWYSASSAGEEQGTFGSIFMANQMKAAGNDVQGMFSNDIVGASQAFDGTKPDPHTCGCSWRASRPTRLPR